MNALLIDLFLHKFAFLRTIKWVQVLLFIVCIKLNGFKYGYITRMILFN